MVWTRLWADFWSRLLKYSPCSDSSSLLSSGPLCLFLLEGVGLLDCMVVGVMVVVGSGKWWGGGSGVKVISFKNDYNLPAAAGSL